MYTFDILGDYFYICGAMECGKMNKLNKLTNISCILDYATSKNEIWQINGLLQSWIN